MVTRSQRLAEYKDRVEGLGHDVKLWGDFWPERSELNLSVGSAGVCEKCGAIIRVLLTPPAGETNVAEIVPYDLSLVELGRCLEMKL